MIGTITIVLIGVILNIWLIKLYKMEWKYLMYLLAIPFFFAGYCYLFLYLIEGLFDKIVSDDN